MPLTITHAKNDTVADFTGTITLNNSAGASTTVLATNLVRPSDWNSAHQYSLSLTGSEIASLFSFGNGLSSTSGAGGVTVGVASNGYFEPFIPENTNSTLSAPGVGTWYFQPFDAPQALGSGQINMLMADALGWQHGAAWSAASTGSVSRSQTMNFQLAIYKLGTGANTTRLESVWSADASFLATWSRGLSTANTSSGTITNGLSLSFPAQWDASGGVTYSSTAQTGTTAFGTSTAASTYANNLITGAAAYLSGSRMHVFPFATSLSAGQYWMAHMFTSTSASAGTQGGVASAGTMFSTQSLLGMLEFVGQAFKRLGKSVSDSSTVFEMFHGSLATTTSTPTSNLGTVDLRNLLTNARAWWAYMQSSY